MKKTKFESTEAINIADKMVNDYASLERNLRELRTILAVICLQQDDKCLTVPFSALSDLPAGVELEVSVDRINSAFQFSLIGADGIPLANQIPERKPIINAPPVRRDGPCEDCPAMQECWNYTKNGDGVIKSWFECSNHASSDDIIDNSTLGECTSLTGDNHITSGLR